MVMAAIRAMFAVCGMQNAGPALTNPARIGHCFNPEILQNVILFFCRLLEKGNDSFQMDSQWSRKIFRICTKILPYYPEI
jgi:hypothetical protein